MLLALHDLPGLAVAGEGEAADDSRIDAVAAVAADSGAEALAGGGRAGDATQVVDDGVGG